MRHLLAGACSLLLLTACGGTVAGSSPASGPAPVRADVTDGAETAHCASPAGFRVDHPADWSVNTGEVLPVCSWFAAEPFTVPEASDARIADITLDLEAGQGLSAVWMDETARRTVDVGGRPAIRVEQVTGPGFYPAGTQITTYVVDLDPGRSDGVVLLAQTVGLPGFDYDRNVDVLDAMMSSFALDGAVRV